MAGLVGLPCHSLITRVFFLDLCSESSPFLTSLLGSRLGCALAKFQFHFLLDLKYIFETNTFLGKNKKLSTYLGNGIFQLIDKPLLRIKHTIFKITALFRYNSVPLYSVYFSVFGYIQSCATIVTI